MPELQLEEFKYPDEKESSQEQLEIEIEDDTPPEDQNRKPLPKDIVEELEEDDLEAFTGEARQKLFQLKKVWNDERREKDAARKEAEEASRIAQQLLSENQKLKTKLSAGEQTLHSKYKENIAHELEKAKVEYKNAYDSGDSDRLVEAQEKLTKVQLDSQQIEQYKPEYSEETLQNSENDVQIQQQPQRLDSKTQAWLDKNSWYGVDEDMSYLAMGIHRRLEREGVPTGSDHYFNMIDKEIRQRFPEKFGIAEETKYSSEVETKPSTKTSKPSTVVAPATRSTSPKKVRLTPTQLQLAKKFNLTPEQYARELTKLESQNG